MSPPWIIRPDWPAPPSVQALCTTRTGGASVGPLASFNLGHHVDDDPKALAANLAQLQDCLPGETRVQWLRQVHGVGVVEAPAGESYPEADACWTQTPGLACAVLTADCLPVLLCNRQGTVVAAAHAGWRGLAAGVLEATLAAMPCVSSQVLAWLGPAIGPAAFEVGPEVRAAFCDAPPNGLSGDDLDACFTSPGSGGHCHADLYRLARLRLQAAGVTAISGGGLCTFSAPARFYSYRRDGHTGRMASVITLAAG